LRRLFEATSALLGRERWAYVLSLMIPFAVLDLALKAASISSWPGDPGLFGALGLMRSDLLFVAGYVIFWVGAFALARRGISRAVVTVAFHATTIFITLITASAHLYFRTTGSTLDYGIISFSLAEFGEIWPVLRSEISAPAVVVLAAMLLYMTLGPYVISRAVARRSSGTGASAATGDLSLESVGVCVLAIGFASLALLPGGGSAGAGVSFARDEFVNVLVTGLEEGRTEELDLSTTSGPLPKDSPVGARLEATEETEKRNVVIIQLESVRARSVTPYNEELKTTPYLDELASQSLLAERAYTTLPHTSKAITSINCGVDPNLTQIVTESFPGGVPAQCLPGLLKEQGYNSAFFQSATEEFEDRRGLVDNFGYEEFFPLESMVSDWKRDTEGFQKANYFGLEDDVMLETSEQWLEQNDEGPFIATYLTVTPHHQYLAPDTYGREDFAEDEVLDDYLNSVRYEDFFVKNLIQQYKDLGLYEDTVFVIVGDHGEGFEEHGRSQHDDVIYEEGLHVPLIVHDPQRFEGGERVENLTNHLDILPTVADLLGFSVEGGKYPGRSLLEPIPDDRTLFVSCYHDDRCLASIRGDSKFIHHYGNQPDELFDLGKDPLERDSLADERPDEVEKRRNEVLLWRQKVDETYNR
jgi:lipoteichoic acid synthase